ncbi:uncharacterized protein LOC115629038 isoform X2 [Scaptodrosophila lebanonensis]|uniref:Uncharacterized protein LOC115629038 isoform X2 n=1 Tax=Drosophila lebanonensis TaxID=7225 RepID=A0A6J2TZW4_DROLE|nr:uncharacterized protein LOC115629038 isoform X2 [Scaptodrosophila lebanonensis]
MLGVGACRILRVVSYQNPILMKQRHVGSAQLVERTQGVKRREWSTADSNVYALETNSSRNSLKPYQVPDDPNYEPCVTFTPNQTERCQKPIGALLADLTAQSKFFYGIEIIPRLGGKPLPIDFNDFLPVLPTFVSVVWLATQYWNIDPIEAVDTVQLVKHLEPRIPTLPHLTVYRMSEQRLDDFLALNLKNLLAVRGDKVHESQPYKDSEQLVRRAQCVRGESLSIGVAGYPEGYTNEPHGAENPLASVEAGAEFVIMQFCYRPEKIVQFILDCCAANINVPIIMGIVVPESFKTYLLMEKFVGVRLPNELRARAEELQHCPAELAKFFEELALNNIQYVLDANVGVCGVQFYTLNHLRSTIHILKKLHEMEILK